jgi:hypothetical protein
MRTRGGCSLGPNRERERHFRGICRRHAQRGAEVMTAIDDVILAFAQPEQLLADIGEDLARLVVARTLGQSPQIPDELQDRQHLFGVLGARDYPAAIGRQQVEIRQQVDGRPLQLRPEATAPWYFRFVTKIPPAKPAPSRNELRWVFEGSGDLLRCLRRCGIGNRQVPGAGRFRSAPGPSQ